MMGFKGIQQNRLNETALGLGWALLPVPTITPKCSGLTTSKAEQTPWDKLQAINLPLETYLPHWRLGPALSFTLGRQTNLSVAPEIQVP